MSLSEEIEAKRQHIRSDGYQMSIGEFSNLYRDGEIVIRPEYQRLFRWNIEKQSRLIESILLGIPMPSVFVAAREDGVWEIVDGLQRISTIFQFMGLLREERTGDLREATKLVATKYLPSLEGISYDNPDDAERSLDVASRIAIKRAKIDVKILWHETDDSVKFELFDRLNSGGQPTSDQEVRTAQLLMSHPDFHRWLVNLRESENFSECLPLTTRQLNEQYDLELALRFLVLRYSSSEVLASFSEFDSLLTDQAIALSTNDSDLLESEFDQEQARDLFLRTFSIIADAGIDVFRRYDERRAKFTGGFTVSSFEAVTIGVAANLSAWEGLDRRERGERLLDLCRELWQDEEFRRRSGAGVRASQRVPVMVSLGPSRFVP